MDRLELAASPQEARDWVDAVNRAKQDVSLAVLDDVRAGGGLDFDVGRPSKIRLELPPEVPEAVRQRMSWMPRPSSADGSASTSPLALWSKPPPRGPTGFTLPQ